MRRGQTLGALLGYRLERRLHDRSGGALELDRFIYVLRIVAPLRVGKLTDPGQPAQESLAASDVVDGLQADGGADGHGDPGDGRRSEGPRAGGLALHRPTGTSRRPDEAEGGAGRDRRAGAHPRRGRRPAAGRVGAPGRERQPTAGRRRAGRAGGRRGRAAGARRGDEPADRRADPASGRDHHPVAASAAGGRLGGRRAAGGGRAAASRRGRRAPSATRKRSALAVGDPRTLADASLSALDVLYDADGDIGRDQHAGRAAPAGPARSRRGPVAAGLDLGDRRSAARPAGGRPAAGRGRCRTPGRGPAGREAADRPVA